MSQNLIPRLFDLLHQKPQNESEDEKNKKRSIDVYCIRILIQLTLHSSGSDYQGSYSDSDFASLLVWSLFSDSYYLRYGGFAIVEDWIHSSSSHKELFSYITIPSPFFSFLTQCPSKEEEDDYDFSYQLRPFDALAVVVSSIAIGMRMNKTCQENLATSLNALSNDINHAEQPIEEWIPKEELKRAKKTIEKLIGMVGSECCRIF